MSKYYNPKRARNLYNPLAREPFKLSRSKVDLFLNCPRCFYLDRRLGVGQPPGYPFSLNSAVDKLLKKEFDIHRAKGTPHPLMKAYGLDAIPFAHEKIDVWRDALGGGITYYHEPSNLILTGGIDDVWVQKSGKPAPGKSMQGVLDLNPKDELLIVDYKATSKDGEVNLDAEWQIGYKRQMEVYQWLFRRNGFNVSSTGFFVYCNGSTDKEAFDGKLEFEIKLIPYEGDDAWVEQALHAASRCLASDIIPETGSDCDYCKYRFAARDLEK